MQDETFKETNEGPKRGFTFEDAPFNIESAVSFIRANPRLLVVGGVALACLGGVLMYNQSKEKKEVQNDATR